MSDGPIWQPPDPGAIVPDPPAGSGRSRGKVIGATVGALAIVGAGTFAIARMAGDGGAGGAATPEDAGRAFMEAIGNEDVLGAVDVMLPGERDALRGPLSELVDELQRLGVLSDDADASAVSGIDVVVEDVEVDAEPTNVDDIVNLSISAAVTGSVDGAALPVGDWIRDELGDELAELDAESSETVEDTVGITAVREDGRWYLSVFHTMAESARRSAGEGDIPDEGITPAGGDDPEAAIDIFLDAVEDLDLEAVIAALDPGELQALQRYAPLFLDDAQAELDEAPLEVSITDRSYRVDGSGDTRTMAIDGVTIEAVNGDQTVSMELRDGCWTVRAPDVEETNSCEAIDDVPALDEVFEDAQPVEDFVVAVQDAFADYENPGFVVRQVDGSWYVSPLATGSEQLLAIVRALTREEIEELQDVATGFVDAMDDVVEGRLEATEEESAIPEDTEIANECWGESDPALAAACFEALVADGEIDPTSVPWYLRHPECGLAELGWNGEYYTLSDDDFVAAVEAAAPCFQELAEAGEADTTDLPVELLRPECLAGRNWYNATDEAYMTEFEECAFG